MAFSGALYRFDTYLVAFMPGENWSYFPNVIEILVTLVVIGIAAAALLGVFSNLIRSSADPAIQQQASTIAESYLEEILLRPFADPQGEVGGGGLEGDEGGRGGYDDVQDYGGLAGPAADQFGNPIPALADYSVSVAINGADLDDISAASGDVLRIVVTVTHPALGPIRLTGYRTNYCPNPALC